MTTFADKPTLSGDLVVLRPLLGIPDEAVSYVHSLAEAEEAVAKKACRLAVLLRGWNFRPQQTRRRPASRTRPRQQ